MAETCVVLQLRRPRRLDKPFFRYSGAAWYAGARHGEHCDGYEDDLTAATDMAEDHRRFDCPSYSLCLEEAAKALWPGFTCKACPRAVRQSREAM